MIYNYEDMGVDDIKEFEKKAKTPSTSGAISYKDRSIGTIYITGGGFIKRPFTGAGANSRFGWEEMVWFSTPSRSKSFAFTNMDDIDVGLVARCEINIKYMNIQDYIDLRKILGRERHFLVEFFDTDSGDWITRDMYCSENNLSKFFTLKQSMIGVIDYSIKLVGTNLDLGDEHRLGSDIDNDGFPSVRNLKISFNPNGGGGEIFYKNKSWGDYLDTPSDTVFSLPEGKSSFSHWERRKNGEVVGVYGANQRTTVWEDMDLFAIWK